MTRFDNQTIQVQTYSKSTSTFTTISFASHISDTGQVILLNESNAKDVSYQEVVTFLAFDETDKIKYDRNKFSCADYALQHNAERKGINCAWVYVDLIESAKNNFADHSCNAFNTTDRGIIFIDVVGVVDSSVRHPSDMDKIVDIRRGELYTPISIFWDRDNTTWEDSGIVSDYSIFWE
jgi:hypothetical protein